MPGAAQNGLEPERFAALWAGCDTGNASEAEALSKFRALRRMAMTEKLRIIDAMGRADVMQALDAQLEPVREESPELKAAFLEVAKIADLAQHRQEVIEALQEQVAAGALPRPKPVQFCTVCGIQLSPDNSCPRCSSAGIGARSPARSMPPRVSDGGMVNGGPVTRMKIRLSRWSALAGIVGLVLLLASFAADSSLSDSLVLTRWLAVGGLISCAVCMVVSVKSERE